MTKAPQKPVILTGDRPTGPLHLGHYVGSLLNRVTMQETHDQYILVADMQALTDNAENPDKVSRNILEVVTDYLAVGIDPQKTKIVLQSQLADIALLYMIYSNLVTVARVERNPTVKEELKQKGLERDIPLGFFSYPVSQAADITAFKATVVPVGQDQLPMIEITNEIVRRFNRVYDCNVLVEAEALVPEVGRLPGIDGKAKMSKSMGKVINLKASPKKSSMPSNRCTPTRITFGHLIPVPSKVTSYLPTSMFSTRTKRHWKNSKPITGAADWVTVSSRKD